MRHVLPLRPVLGGLALLAAVLPVGPAAGQPVRPSVPRTAQASPDDPVPADPQRTTASFGDWTLRCERPEGRPRTCEVGQYVLNQGQAVAQAAVGRPAPGQPWRFTLLVPPNVTLATAPRLTGAPGSREAPSLELAWRRCLPSGCVADAPLPDAVLGRLRAQAAEPARILFQDGAGREVALPFSARGFAQALDALTREETR